MLDDSENKDNNSADKPALFSFGGFIADAHRRKLFSPDGDIVTLSSRAFDTLLVLLKNQGETLSKSQLMAEVWPDAIVEENNLNQAIFGLRKALSDTTDNCHFILTIPGRGYSFIAPVEIKTENSLGENDFQLLPQAYKFNVSIHSAFLMLCFLLVIGTGIAFLSQSGSSDTQQNINASNGITTLTSPDFQFEESINNSIAVLPFSTLDSNAANTLFSQGLHVEVISQLSKISRLNVIARNSVISLVDQQLPLAEIARLLRVESFLSGSILFVGEKARISLHIYDAESGITLWSNSYEANQEDLEDMISIQSEIAGHIASAFKTDVTQFKQENDLAIPTKSFEAYRFYLAATNAHYQQDYKNEWELARQAIRLDPEYYDALFTFSSVNTLLVASPLPGMSSNQHFELALESANKLISLSPENAQGYAMKANALSTNKDWNGISDLIEKLIEIDAPASELSYIAIILMNLGDFDSAIDIYRARLISEPLNLFARGFLMAALEISGQREAAIAEYELGEELSPVWWGDMVNVFLALGRNEPLQDIDDLTGVASEIIALLHLADRPDALQTELIPYLHAKNINSADAIYFAALAAYTGRQEMAVTFIRTAVKENYSALFWLWLPVFDETRSLGSFRDIIEESGMVDYWQEHGWPEVCHPLENSFTCERSAYQL